MTNKNLIFLCGFMGCGKTTHGKKLAKALGYHFIDLDDYTSNKYDKAITDLFQEVGEDEFRKIETQSLAECINDNIKTVIALGGGTPCFNNNVETLKANGLLVYLKMNADDLYQRIFNAKAKRPLVAEKTNEEMLNYIQQLLATRESIYQQAHLSVNGTHLNEEELKKVILDHLAN